MHGHFGMIFVSLWNFVILQIPSSTTKPPMAGQKRDDLLGHGHQDFFKLTLITDHVREETTH